MISFSIILPILQQDPPSVLIRTLLEQMSPRDELIVVGDGPKPEARKALVASDPRLMYLEFGPTGAWGHPQRNVALRFCDRDFVFSLQEDNELMMGALETIRKTIEDEPERPLLFRAKCADQILWRSQELVEENVRGQLFVVPNLKGHVGKWGRRREGFFDFAWSTIMRYPQGKDKLAWRKDILTITSQSVVKVN